MSRDVEGFANVVTLAIKAALAPVLERVAVTEQANRDLQARVGELLILRDQVVPGNLAMKLEPWFPQVNLTPVLERVAATDARVARLAGLELTVGELKDRVLTIETKAATPIVAVQDASSRPTAAEVELSLRDKLEPLTKHLAALSERVAVAEVRAPVPGPTGPAGKDGINGTDGKDGADGFAFEDLSVAQQDDRSFTIKAIKGDRVKEIGTARFTVQIQRGVYLDGKSYDPGDVVTWGGSQWYCNETTTAKPGDGSKAWTLIVKRGRDGKDGRDAETVPVVSLGRHQ